MPRPISTIARDIALNWERVNYAAKPYLEAMAYLNSINDMYYADTARSIVAYFLSNARAFTGPEARRLKAELKAL